MFWTSMQFYEQTDQLFSQTLETQVMKFPVLKKTGEVLYRAISKYYFGLHQSQFGRPFLVMKVQPQLHLTMLYCNARGYGTTKLYFKIDSKIMCGSLINQFAIFESENDTKGVLIILVVCSFYSKLLP